MYRVDYHQMYVRISSKFEVSSTVKLTHSDNDEQCVTEKASFG